MEVKGVTAVKHGNKHQLIQAGNYETFGGKGKAGRKFGGKISVRYVPPRSK